jgi:dipeptidyl aminopeptidase/acylaminoacyl peptidase
MRVVTRSALAACLVLLGGAPIHAQDGGRPLTLEDYGAWARIGGTTLSPDGGWLAWSENPNDGDARFIVRSLRDEREYEAINGASPAFSDDGRWIAFLTRPPESEREGASGDGPDSNARTLHIIDLANGTRMAEPGVRGFEFGGEGGLLAIHKDRSDADAEHQGSDLLMRDLARGTVLSFGNAAQFSFNDSGTHLAWLVDAVDRAGNGLYMVEVESGRLRALDTNDAYFDDLAWNEAGDAVLALRGTTPDGQMHRDNDLVIVDDLDAAPRVSVWRPSDEPSFPDGFIVSEAGPTRWVEGGRRIEVGLKEQEVEIDDEGSDDERPDVDVWHWDDDRLQSQQMIQAGADRRFTFTAVVDLDAGTFARLATDDMPRVDLTDDGRWGIGRRDGPYRGDVTAAGGRADIVRVDPRSGDTRVVAEGVRRPMGASPDGRWYVYAQDEVVYLTNLESMETVDLTASTGIDFIDREFDVIAERPAYGLGGWTEGARELVLYTRFDIFAVSTDDGTARDLTDGMGARDEMRFRIQPLDRDADWLDLDDAVLSAYGEWTKKSGYFALRDGAEPRPLLFGDEMIGGLQKAGSADRVVFTRQTFERFPDLWVSDLDFADPRRVSDANPQIAEFAWGSRVLIDYTDARGHALQATLTLPAGYVAGEQYPMVVYFYEKMSQRHHQFSMPVYDDRPHMSTYASNGYLVLMPDIVYEPGRPGSSALDDVTSAVSEVVELGYADPEQIGLQGHSWGGYESSFIVTQTDMFSAVVTGAPLTNLMSMYNINYKSSGSGNGPILEWSQGRLGTTPWDDFELFVSQSPIHHTPGISTPFLILHGTEDGAVDWNQGLEFYNAARRLEKEVILLSYPGEPHHLAREANQKDFQRRMMQYFDHHLRGTPAAEWIEKGVPFLSKGKEARPKIIS